MTDADHRLTRIAHVALQLDTGGMERLLAEFARHVDRGRFELHFVALGSRGPVADDIESCGWPVTTLNIRPGVRPYTLLRLAQFFRDERIDLVHTHNTKPLLYAGPAARLAQVRGIVHTRHGQRFGATPKQSQLFRLAGRCAHRIVCVSEDSQRLCALEGVDGAATTVIWNGIDRSRFQFTGPAPGGPALFVGRLSPEKDVASLLRATARVVASLPDFRVQIAGAGPCRAELEGLAASLNLNGNIEFLGEVSDVPRLFERASMFVLPSLTEGLPLTALEAMACGIPVVAARVGGTPEAVVHEQTGLLVEPRAPEQLAGAMLRIALDAELGRKMGLAGFRRAAEFFDVRTMVARYESLYRDVLKGTMQMAA